MPVNLYQTTRRHIPEYSSVHAHSHKNFNAIYFFIFQTYLLPQYVRENHYEVRVIKQYATKTYGGVEVQTYVFLPRH
jgi:hypothetical protein